MIHALVLGLVIAIVLLILIQKVTSGFTAAECDARYTIDYRACGDAYEKAKRACRGRDKTSCEQTALRAKEACTDAAASAKIACLGPAAATGDVVATHQLQAAQNQSNRTSSPPAVSGSSRVTPGAALPPSDSHGSRGNQGNQGNQAPPTVAAPPPLVPVPAPPTVAAPPPFVPVPASQMRRWSRPPVLAVPAPPTVAAPPPPVPAPAEAPSAIQMTPCAPGETEMTFGGQKPNEDLDGGPREIRMGESVCRKPAPGPYQCDFASGYTYHGGAGIQPECLKPRTV